MANDQRGGAAVFRFANFRFLLAGRFVWNLGLQMLSLALAWRVYELTHDPFALGLIGLFTFAPALPLSFVTGAVADRHDRRMVLALTCVALLVALAAFIAAPESLGVWPAYALVVVVGGARAFSQPASMSLLSNIVPDAEFPSATAWSNTSNQLATILGPSIGGLLYPFGHRVPFTLSFALGAVALATTLMIGTPTASGRKRPPVNLVMLLAGWRFIWMSPAVLGAMSLDLVAVFFGGATALLPVYASDVFHVGPWGLGLLRSSLAAGSILAALALAHTPLGGRVGLVLLGAVFAYGGATIGFGLAPNMAVGMLCLAVLGAADSISVVIRQSLVQINTPDEMRGRVASVHNIVASASNNLGDFESGTLASIMGATTTIVFGGVCAVIASGLWGRLFPDLRARDRL